VVEKIKELNLMTEDWLCVCKSWGTKALVSPLAKMLEGCRVGVTGGTGEEQSSYSSQKPFLQIV